MNLSRIGIDAKSINWKKLNCFASKFDFNFSAPELTDAIKITRQRAKSGKTVGEFAGIQIEDFYALPNISGKNYRFIISDKIEDFRKILTKKLKKDCVATIPQVGDCWLKGTKDMPLATSGVGDCALLCLSNSQTQSQALFHAYPYRHDAVVRMKKVIYDIMPEGFDSAIIIPGCLEETKRTSWNLFRAINEINRKAKLRFQHTELPYGQEFVLYNGKVYTIPLKKGKSNFRVTEADKNYGSYTTT